MLKGFRTIAVGFLIAAVPSGLQYLGGIDWTQYVSPQVAPLIVGAIMILLRAVSTGPIGRGY